MRQTNQNKRTLSTDLISEIKNFDIFRSQFKFQLPNGTTSVTSYPGICATFLLVLLTISYGILNIIELASFGQSTIRLDEIDYHYNDSYVFDLDKKPGLNIAFGFTHYDNNPEPIDDPDYGEVIAEIKTWGGTSGT